MKLQAFNPYAGRWTRRVLEYNPYHGKDGRFTGKSGAASTVAYAGRPSLGNRKDATAAEVAYRKVAGVDSPRLRQDNRERGGGIGAETAYRLARKSLQGKTTDGRPDSPHVRREMADGWKKTAAEKTARRRKTAGGDRQAVPQDPKKYTRGMSDGEARTQRETGAAMRADDVKFHGSARLGQDFRSETSSKSKRSHGHASRVIGLQREARRRGERDIISRPDIKMLRDSAKRYSGQEASSRQAAANDNFKAELAARKGRPRRKAAPPPAPDRQSVPQNPSKYTRPMSDGQRRRDNESWQVAAARVRPRSIRMAQGGPGSKKANASRTDWERSEVRRARKEGNPEAARQAVHDAARRLKRDLPGGRGTGRNKADERRMKAERKAAPFSPRIMQDEYGDKRGPRGFNTESGQHFQSSLAYRAARTRRNMPGGGGADSWRKSGDEYRAAAKAMRGKGR